ncbi:penicillin-binding protein [Nitriliruptoraceae bacterium ZYF776]|nr:penicillin-binding protein [Profundirhabdus halotolerans]
MGPRKPTTRPAGTSKLRSSTASCAPKRLVSPRTETAGAVTEDSGPGRDHRPYAPWPAAEGTLGLLLRRAAKAAVAATVTVAALTVLVAWIALRVEWDVPEPAALTGPTELRDADGRVIARFTAEVDRRLVALDDVAPVAVAAVVAAEDARFYEHDGVDPLSLVRAVVANVRTGGISQGGSTLTQQYVKNAFVGDDQTLLRKVREAVIAIQLERTTSKEEILERYLNAVSFGEGAYGIEAAARTYFGVRAADLDAAQAATLAQLLPAPSVRNPRNDPDGARVRRDALLARMGQLDLLDDAEVTAAQERPLEVADRPRVTTDAPAFVGYVRRQLEAAYGPDAVLTGGLRVETTFRPDVQAALDEAVAEVLPAELAGEVEAAAVALDPRTGDLLAIHGGRDLQLGDLDLATMARRQNGSAFKPFVLSAALTDGLVEPTTRRPSPGRVTIDDCVDHDGGPIEVRGGPGGSTTVHEAMVASVNTTYQLLGCELGGPRIVREARRLGAANRIGTDAAVALGGSSYGASVLDMASAYATFANDGLHCPAHAVTRVRDLEGADVPPPSEVTTVPGQDDRFRRPPRALLDERPDRWVARDDGDCVAVLDRRVARQVTEALVDVVGRGTGREADIGRPQAGKTGTTSDTKDAWFVGYTPELVIAVWVGDPGRDGEVTALRDVAGVGEVFGGTLPARIWATAARRVLDGVDPTPFPRSDDVDEEDAGAEEAGPSVGPRRSLPAPTAPPPPPSEPDPEDAATDAEVGGDPDGPEADGPPVDDEVAPPDDEAPPDEPAPDPGPPDEPDGADEDRCLIVFTC